MALEKPPDRSSSDLVVAIDASSYTMVMGVNDKRAQRAERLVADVEGNLREAERGLADLRSEIDEPGTGGDAFATAGVAFADELRDLLGDTPPASGAVRRAARLAVAEQAWEQRLGELLDTRDVVDLLGVSKQRVSRLVAEHRLIAIPQAGRPRFPAWQFVVASGDGRACLAAAHRALVETGGLSPWSAASWLQGGHPELEGEDPVGFLRAGGEHGRLLRAAQRDAQRAGQ